MHVHEGMSLVKDGKERCLWRFVVKLVGSCGKWPRVPVSIST